jgi:uncharacterized protein YbgA (DUF1722 family)
MTEHDKKWYMHYEQLVDFKRKYGHCMVPQKSKEDRSLGEWVNRQRTFHKNDKIRLDRKRILDELGFAWKDEGVRDMNDKLWHQQYEKLVEFKRNYGHCMVPRRRNEEHKSLGEWVNTQRRNHNKNKMRPDRKEELLGKIGFAWKRYTVAARASTTDVRGLGIGSFHPLRVDHVSHSTRSFSAYFLCRLRIRKRSPAVWVSKTKHHQRNQNQHKAARESNAHRPTVESDQVPALSKEDKWSLVQSKEAMQQAAAVLWRQIVVSPKTIPTRLQ